MNKVAPCHRTDPARWPELKEHEVHVWKAELDRLRLSCSELARGVPLSERRETRQLCMRCGPGSLHSDAQSAKKHPVPLSTDQTRRTEIRLRKARETRTLQRRAALQYLAFFRVDGVRGQQIVRRRYRCRANPGRSGGKRRRLVLFAACAALPGRFA